MPLYGYNWILPFSPANGYARRVSPLEAVQNALTYNAAIQYDQKAQSPFYTYYDINGIEHIVWFEDARSVLAKFTVAHQYGLRGVSYWVLGAEFPQNWLVLADLFNIRKLI